MKQGGLTGRQIFFLVALFMLGNLVTAGGAKSIPGGWIILLALAPLSVVFVALYASASDGQEAHLIFPRALGKPLGAFVTGGYCILAILMAGDSVRLFADFIVINDLNDAGAWGNTALLTVLVLAMLYCDLQSLGRCAWLTFPTVGCFLLLSVLVTVREMKMDNLFLPTDLRGETLLRGISGSLAGTLAPVLFLVFTVAGKTEQGWERSARKAAATSCILLALLSFRDGAVLGYPTAEIFRFPGFTAASVVRHSEVLISGAFVLCQAFRTALCLRYACTCLNGVEPRLRNWYPTAVLGLSILSGALSWSSEKIRWRTGGELVVVALFLLGPIAVLTARRIKGRRSI